LFTKEELFEAMKLKANQDKLFRHSFFLMDIEMLGEKYGDLGYANADINPRPTFNRENQTVDIVYEITKGEKVYFGTMLVSGNVKTRDNVVRREMLVTDSELYSGSRLNQSKREVERLGFFEEVQVLKEYDEQDKNMMHLRYKVKEKPTGQLQAAVGFTPGQGTTEASWFGQGRYDEKNQSGKGYELNLTGRWNGGRNYSIESQFYNPRVNDSLWSFGIGAFYRNEVREILEEIEVQERRYGGNVSVGRTILEKLRGTLIYQIQKTEQESDQFLLTKFLEEGISSSVTLKLSRNTTDNMLDPTQGSDLQAAQKFTGGPLLGGDFRYMESWASAAQFVPIDFTEKYRTYFRFYGLVSYIYPMGDENVPSFERYRLGGYDDLRGYDLAEIGPKYSVLQAPGGAVREFNKGGDKKLLFQAEYFVPLIPEAGIKALVFGDAGRVYDDMEPLEFKNFKKDFGFGFRWITPIAPFRFEWAYPVMDDGSIGDMKFVFYIGY
jgi:outer membrane protein insertion porin family